MKLIKFLCFVILMLVLGNITLANRSVDESLRVAELSAAIKQLEDENLVLTTRIAAAGSLQNLTPRLSAAGYVARPVVVALPTHAAVALR